MGAAFAKDTPQLLESYNKFIGKAQKDGTYLKLISKYYPTPAHFFPTFQGMK